ncbi:MAG: hypothetical protein ABIQ52_01110 [Vicinamibacterales bacterium]
MTRRRYLVVLAVLLALAVTGVYLRLRAGMAAAAIAGCTSPAPPPPPSAPPPKLPGFAIEPACGTGADSPKPTGEKK